MVEPVTSEIAVAQEPKVIIWGDKATFPSFYNGIIKDPKVDKLLTGALIDSGSNPDSLQQALSLIQEKLPSDRGYLENFKELVALVGVNKSGLVWLVASGELTHVGGDLFDALGMINDFMPCTEVAIIHTHPSNMEVIASKGMGTVPLPGWSPEDKAVLSREGNRLGKLIPNLQRVTASLVTSGPRTPDSVITTSSQVQSDWTRAINLFPA